MTRGTTSDEISIDIINVLGNSIQLTHIAKCRKLTEIIALLHEAINYPKEEDWTDLTQFVMLTAMPSSTAHEREWQHYISKLVDVAISCKSNPSVDPYHTAANCFRNTRAR